MKYWKEEKKEKKERRKKRRQKKREKKERKRRKRERRGGIVGETTKIRLYHGKGPDSSIIEKVHRYYNGWSKLYRSQSFLLELQCLRELGRYFECSCGRGPHFPRVVHSQQQSGVLGLSHCGTSLNTLRRHITVEDAKEQIDCIIENLQRSRIRHFDMSNEPLGKNLCVSGVGVLAVIDFDVACIGSDFQSHDLRNISRSFGTSQEYYRTFRRQIVRTLKRCPYITVSSSELEAH